MQIRKTTPKDLIAVLQIYADARQYMAESGNPNQWHSGHPRREIIESDISVGKSYVCVNGEEILAVFFFDIAPDPTYIKIDGAWPTPGEYGVVHRIARAPYNNTAKGAGAFCINWCCEHAPHIRIDTHKDNTPMLVLLQKLGFKYCGVIWLENGEERLAFSR